MVGLDEGDEESGGAVAGGALAEVAEPVGGRQLPGAEDGAGPADAGLVVERERRLDGAAVGLAVVAKTGRVEGLDGAVPQGPGLGGRIVVEPSRAVLVVVSVRDEG